MQALTIMIGIVAFGTEVTTLLILGVAATIITSSIYAYLKTSNVLEQKPKEATEAATEMETRVHLRSDDAAAEAS